MIKSYLLTALRNIKKHKIVSLINIVGLSISLAIVILIVTYIKTDLSVNKFHKNYDNIYKIGKSTTPSPIADILKVNLPQIKNVTRIDNVVLSSTVVKYNDAPFTVKDVIMADPDFFEIFTFDAVAGDPVSALSEPMTIVLTESLAKRIFGAENPINKKVKIDNAYDFTVKSVIKDIPDNSSLKFNGVVSFVTMPRITSDSNHLLSWKVRNYETYFLFPGKGGVSEIDKLIRPVITSSIPEGENDFDTEIVPYKNIYYESKLSSYNAHGSIQRNVILISVALLILIVAIINYINLSTARASARAKEIGIRQTIGATRSMLIKQLINESIIVSVISMVIAVLLTWQLLPAFNQLVDIQLSFYSNFTLANLVIVLIFALLLGSAAGIYPAIYLTSSSTSAILQEQGRIRKSKIFLRKLLIISQFSIATILIISTIIIYQQTEFMQNKPLGFQKENILYFQLNNEMYSSSEVIKSRILANSAVQDFAYSSSVPGEMRMVLMGNIESGGIEKNVNYHAAFISSDFIRLMGMKIVSGRNFIGNDKGDEWNVIINQAFAKEYAVDNPLEATLNGGTRIVGVVKDFNYNSLNSIVEPLVFINFPAASFGFGIVKIKAKSYNEIKSVINQLESLWNEVSPDYPIEYSFLDDKLAMQYKDEERFEKAFLVFSSFAVFIGCLGLFGLSLFSAEQRTKEIGVRKILGASIPHVVFLLTRQFMLVVILANIAAWPVAYFLTNNWLENYAYRIDVGPWAFIISSTITLFVAFVTIGYQTAKAATANPVDALRYE